LRDASEIAKGITDQKEAGGTSGIRLQDKIKQIVINFSRYAKQIDDLNYLEHMKLRRGVLQKDTVNLTTVIGDLIRLYESEAEAKKVQLKSQLLDGCFLKADEKAISSVFRNLISNSIEHNEAEGEGWVALEMKMEMKILLSLFPIPANCPGKPERLSKRDSPFPPAEHADSACIWCGNSCLKWGNHRCRFSNQQWDKHTDIYRKSAWRTEKR